MMDMENLRVLLVDNDEAFAEHFWVYAELAGWQHDYLEGDDLTLLHSTLDSLKPHLLLLDAHLPLSLQEWLEALDEDGYLNHTWVVSGNMDDLGLGRYEGNIAGIREKPISLGELPDLAKISLSCEPMLSSVEPPSILEDKEIGQYAKQLGVAVSLHYIVSDPPKYSPPSWVNRYYEHSPITTEGEELRLSLLVARLREENDQPFVRHVESSLDGKTLHYSRLYRLPDSPDYYWYVREALARDIAPHSFYKPHLELKTFLNEVPNLFKHYGITRIRFYEAYKLFDDTKIENKESYLFEPYWQSGGGVREEWGNCFFTTEDRLDLKKIFEGEVNISIKSMKDTSYYIDWGEQEVDRVIVAIMVEKNAPKKSNEPLGLLTFDRRYDHLPEEERNKSSWWKIYNDKAGGKGEGIGRIKKDELKKMKGLIDQIVNEIRDHRIRSKANQIKLWHEVISDAIRDVLPGISTQLIFKESRVVEEFLAYLVKWWNYIDEEPTDDDLPESVPQTKKNPTITNWYFLKEEFGEGIRGLGGYGSMADIRREKTSRIISPFRQSLEVDDSIGVYAIQDFAEWVKPKLSSEYNQEQQKIDSRYLTEVGKIGSWLGIRLQVADQRYLMVVHTLEKHYFTTRRVKLLRIVALRMSPFLLWDDMRKSRDNLLRSVNHELRSPLSSLQQEVRSGILEQTSLLEQLQFLAATINNMMYVYRDVPLSEQHICLDAVVPTLEFARQAQPHPQRELVIKGMHGYGKLSLAVPEDVLKQVLFNLLNNAFKFADKRGANRNAPIIFEIRQKQDYLVCKISNPIGDNNRMGAEERKWIFTLNYRAKDSGVASGSGLGLYIVDKLCQKTGMTCVAEEAGTINAILYQTFILSIPIYCRGSLA
jgi:signal transduction histidine kinase